ncbi:MAG: hypothetical protein EOM92_09025 [Gammaproteobacteria bacterium]|nr:hypothetical protein [Gammaproteobacteria bacterium]
MDQEMFRQAYQAINERFCPYEKTLLTNHGNCSRAERFCIAEREGVRCNEDAAQARCEAFLALARQNARFALKATDQRTALPHAKAMRVQVGGLRGLQLALTPDRPPPTHILDIDRLLNEACARFGDLASAPFQTIIQQIAAFQGRKRSGRKTP